MITIKEMIVIMILSEMDPFYLTMIIWFIFQENEGHRATAGSLQNALREIGQVNISNEVFGEKKNVWTENTSEYFWKMTAQSEQFDHLWGVGSFKLYEIYVAEK